ncbi:MAG: DNA cytosine methyltransferase [Elusimicrobiota bacterium]
MKKLLLKKIKKYFSDYELSREFISIISLDKKGIVSKKILSSYEDYFIGEISSEYLNRSAYHNFLIINLKSEKNLSRFYKKIKSKVYEIIKRDIKISDLFIIYPNKIKSFSSLSGICDFLQPELFDLPEDKFEEIISGGKTSEKKIKFIDLFAGIGGFHLAFHECGSECVFASEWDQKARETYFYNFKKISDIFDKGMFVGDITKIDPSTIPDFDVLTAGFPCQPFSQAGHKKGFNEARGTLFFDIANIISIKKPSAFFLENVSHLLKHDNGKTFGTIKKILTKDLGYSFFYKIVKASDFGLPQHRPRLFMVGFKNKDMWFSFPQPKEKLDYTMSDIFNGRCDREIGFTLRVGGRGSDIEDRRNWDTYRVDGKIVRLTPKEGLMMQGFPKWFSFPKTVSSSQAMKQLGNSVAVPAIKAVARNIISKIRLSEKLYVDIEK